MANKAWNSWKTTPFDWWQCQLNFAVWCATAGCGVSVEDYFQATDPLLASLYRFHVYFTTRRILKELRVAFPGEKSHSWYLNTFDARAHKRLCSEFCVSPETDWRQMLDHGCQGLGSWSTYMETSGACRHAHYSDGPFFHPKDAITGTYQGRGRCLDKSEGFTQTGVERLNNSVRTYVWAILGAQTQTRSNILKAGTVFDAQKQFLGTDHKRPLKGKPAAADAAEQPRPERAAAASHEDEKTALIVAGVGVGLLALWLASR